MSQPLAHKISDTTRTKRRARTDEDKRQRRETILRAADTHFAAAGFEAFSMAELGKLSGVAKGTLYLYYETREEVLMALHLAKLSDWEERMHSRLDSVVSDDDFISALHDTMSEDAAMLRLMSRLDSVIEHNISIDTLIAAKRQMAATLSRVASSLARRLQMTEREAFDVLAGLGSLMIGTCQTDAGPRYDDDVLPEDVRTLMQAFSARDLFTVNARRILAGIRGGI